MNDLCRLLDAPGEVSTLSVDERRVLRVRVAALAAALDACETERKPEVAKPDATDRLLTAKQVAEKFGRTVDWVYRKAQEPAWKAFTIREGGGTTRFSEARLDRYLARHGR